MRAGPIIAGSILLVLGLAAAITGGVFNDMGDLCIQTRCDSEEAIMLGVVGNGIFVGGALLGLAGIALLVAGIVTDAPSRTLPVVATSRACPSCGVDGPRDARYCSSCGAAVAPTLVTRS